MDMVETRLKESLGRVGLQARISWAETEKTDYEGQSGLYAFIRKPIVWALWASGCAVLILDGLGTLLWALLWAACCQRRSFSSPTERPAIQKDTVPLGSGV
ncbi:hypothetical protein MASR2M79_24520 [Aminivibrio sp.]